MAKMVCTLMLLLMLIGYSFAIAQPGMPLGIGGMIIIDDMPVGGITVQVVNLNTGEHKTTTTAYDTPHTKCGYYTVALTGQNEDVIKVTVTYGNTYSNTCVVNLNLVTQWINISISTEEPYEPPDDPPYNPPDNGGDNGDEPPDDTPEEPENNETEEPDNPLENNTDNDIPNLYNLTVTVFGNNTNNTSPVNNASVTIYDSNETKITKSYTNDSGKAIFQLEEGNYIVEVKKGSYVSERNTFSLLASMEYPMYMTVQNDDSSTGSIQQDDQKQSGIPFVYIGVAVAVIIIVGMGIFFYRRSHS